MSFHQLLVLLIVSAVELKKQLFNASFTALESEIQGKEFTTKTFHFDSITLKFINTYSKAHFCIVFYY